MNMNHNSSVIFVSSDDRRTGDSLIECMLGSLPDNIKLNNLNVYPWHINTKYYEVDVNLCVLDHKELQSEEFSELTEAVVLFFDPNNANWMFDLNGWLPFLNEFNSEIKILLCEKCEESKRDEVLDWCLKERYELVELQGIVEDEDFPETVGIARVKQALEAHIWPNLSMKERREPTKMADLLSGINREPNLSHFLSEALEQDDNSDLLKFDNLFSNLMSMKEKAMNMESDQRKDFAEKVVTAFLNAIGGDSDDLSGDSDNSVDETNYKKL